MGGIACCQAAAAGAESGLAELPIIDTHEHLWDLSRFHLPWLKPGEPLCRSYVPKDYQEASAELNIVKSVYMEAAMDPADEAAEAQAAIALCQGRATPMCGAVIGGRPAGPRFRQYLLPFKGGPCIKGVRQVLGSSSDLRLLAVPDDLVRGLRLLGEWGMCFDLCIPPTALADGARLIGRCPQTRFVLDHCGNADPKAFRPGRRNAGPQPGPTHDPEQWRRDIRQIARHKNVVCKISGIVSQLVPGRWTPDDLAPIVNHCLDTFGPERVMFAGDWPVCTRGASLRQWVEALKSLVGRRGPADQRRLFHDNAVRFYGLA
jgi:predicted TIM-barrel fold metal-dependent hydrolase